MSEADELAWHRDWRTRLMSALRLWFKPTTYQQACRAWSSVLSILNESPPGAAQRKETE